MVLSIKQRIKRVEQSKPAGAQVAVFYIPGNIPIEEQNKLKEKLWDDYLDDGGDPNMQMVIDRNVTDQVGFIKSLSSKQWFQHISNRSKSPADTFKDTFA